MTSSVNKVQTLDQRILAARLEAKAEKNQT